LLSEPPVLHWPPLPLQAARLGSGGSGLLEFGPSDTEFINFFERIPGARHPATVAKDLETRYVCNFDNLEHSFDFTTAEDN
jgi:hypothetical protein